MVASTDTSSPVIVVFGATGTQGASVVDHLIASEKSYYIKGVTRDPSKPNAKALADKKVEVIQAQLGDQSSIEKAIKGADYVFGVTNFWEAGESELQHGKNLVNAVKSAAPDAVFLWSGLSNVSKISGGKYKGVHHFDMKAQITDYARQSGIKIVDVQPAGYFENFLTVMTPRKQDNGGYVVGLPLKPEAKWASLNCRRDYGAFVVGALESGRTEGTVYAATGEPTIQEMVDAIAKGSGKQVAFYSVPADQFRSQAGDEMTQMLEYFNDFGYYGGADLAPSQKLVKDGQDITAFAKEADWSKVLN